MKMGGRGPGGSESRIFVRGNPYKKPKTQRIWPTIFLKMGGLSPALSKIGGRVPPPCPPCGGAPADSRFGKGLFTAYVTRWHDAGGRHVGAQESGVGVLCSALAVCFGANLAVLRAVFKRYFLL